MFNPSSIAIIGASSDPSKWGCWLAEQVIRHEQLRRVYFINPKREIIYGERSLATIQEIPEPIDLAVVAVKEQYFEQVIDELIQHGVKTIVGITACFIDVREKCRRAGVTLIGPNCAGIWDSYSPLHCLPISEFESGPVGFISQSGGIITDLGLRLKEVGLGYSKVVSIGNDNSCVNDLLLAMEADEHTEIIAIYSESALEPIPASITKPVVVLMPWATRASVRAAKSHTNSRLPVNFGNVRTLTELTAVIQLLLSKQNKAGNRLAIVTDTGGMGVMLAGEAERAGFEVSDPIDLIGIKGAYTEPTLITMCALQQSHDVDAMIFVLFLIENADLDLDADRRYGMKLANAARRGGKPVVFVCKDFTTPGTKALLEQGMPVYRDIETAVYAMETLCGL